MSHAQMPSNSRSDRGALSSVLAVLIAAVVGAVLAVVGVVGATASLAADGPGPNTPELVSYDQ